MSQVIVYTTEEGYLAEVIPVNKSLTIEEVAAKSVPAGVDYRIVERSTMPTDRTCRDGS